MKNQMLKQVHHFGVKQDNEKEHEINREWVRELRAEKDNMKSNDISITKMIKEQVKKIPNRKSPGPDGIQCSSIQANG